MLSPSYKDLKGSNQVAPQTFKTREAADQFLAIKQAEQIAEKQAGEKGSWILNKDCGAAVSPCLYGLYLPVRRKNSAKEIKAEQIKRFQAQSERYSDPKNRG